MKIQFMVVEKLCEFGCFCSRGLGAGKTWNQDLRKLSECIKSLFKMDIVEKVYIQEIPFSL